MKCTKTSFSHKMQPYPIDIGHNFKDNEDAITMKFECGTPKIPVAAVTF